MTPPLLVLLLVAAADPDGNPAVVRAEDPGPDPAVTQLSTPAELARLCRALLPPERLRVKGDAVARGEAEADHDAARDAAIKARYQIVTSATGVPFAPYDGPERRLSLHEPVQIPFADGTGKVWPTEERALPVDVDAATARRVLDSQRRGTLGIALVFDLPDDATCGVGDRGRKFTVPAEPVAWYWLDGETVIAQGGAARDRPALSASQGARPKVDVGDPIAGPPEAKKAVLSRGTELLACYAKALERDPAVDGVMVADLGGARPAIAMDSVGDAALAACVARALGPLAPAQGGRVAIPIRFVLVPPGGEKDARTR